MHAYVETNVISVPDAPVDVTLRTWVLFNASYRDNRLSRSKLAGANLQVAAKVTTAREKQASACVIQHTYPRGIAFYSLFTANLFLRQNYYDLFVKN